MEDHRQLLAIMFTDVVGYTAVTERDEAAAVRVRTQPRDLVRSALAALIPNVRFEIVEAGHIESTSGTPDVRAGVIEFFDEEAGPRPVAAP